MDTVGNTQLYSIEEAAKHLAISRARFYQLVKAGEIRTVHVGRLHRVSAGELVTYVERLHAAEPQPASA